MSKMSQILKEQSLIDWNTHLPNRILIEYGKWDKKFDEAFIDENKIEYEHSSFWCIGGLEWTTVAIDTRENTLKVFPKLMSIMSVMSPNVECKLDIPIIKKRKHIEPIVNLNHDEKIKQILQQCITNKDKKLDLSGQNLKVLPDIPLTIEELIISNNQLTDISNLENKFHILKCDNNKITKLPCLYEGLTEFYCNNNNLEELPIIPKSVKILHIQNNNIKLFPKLSNKIEMLRCENNNFGSEILTANEAYRQTTKNINTNLKYKINSGKTEDVIIDEIFEQINQAVKNGGTTTSYHICLDFIKYHHGDGPVLKYFKDNGYKVNVSKVLEYGDSCRCDCKMMYGCCCIDCKELTISWSVNK